MINLRKYASILLIFVFLFAFSSVRCRIVVKASNQIIHVPTSDYPTIQSAIDNASSDATILVAGGIYNEHLTIGKSLSIIGQDRDTTIIDSVRADYVISITADNVAIEGFTITKTGERPSDSGIRAIGATGTSVRNTKIMNTSVGLTLSFSNNNFMSNNIILNNTNGIFVLYSNDNTFSNNDVHNNSEVGISLYYSNNNVFSGNTVSNNTKGVYVLSPSNRNYFYHNNFEDEVQVKDATLNIWNRNGEGNYWIRYNFTERDLDSDGIGNEPYYIDELNQDNFPLMGTFYEFSVMFKQEVFDVNVISNSTISDLGFEIGKETGSKILSLRATGENHTIGFCRMMIPTALMDYPFTVLDREGEVTPSLLNASSEMDTYLYFTYFQDDQSISVISSKALQDINDLLAENSRLRADLDYLNTTYRGLLTDLNTTYQALLNSFNLLLEDFNDLQNSYLALNTSLQKSLTDQSENVQNIRNITYIFAGTTAAFLMTAAYLSTRLNSRNRPKTKVAEEEG